MQVYVFQEDLIHDSVLTVHPVAVAAASIQPVTLVFRILSSESVGARRKYSNSVSSGIILGS